MLQKAKEYLNISEVKNQNNLMTATIATDAFEKSFYFGKNLAGENKVSPIFDGTSNSSTIDLSNGSFIPYGVIHNHNGPPENGYPNFSSTDINALNEYFHTAMTIEGLYVNGSDGSLYVMTIQDQYAFNHFVEQYPRSSIDVASPTNPNGTGDWKEGLDIKTDENNTYIYFKDQGKSDNEAYDLTMAYLANKYNMGIVISKKGDDGNFHPIQAESFETTDPITGEKKTNFRQINPCNL